MNAVFFFSLFTLDFLLLFFCFITVILKTAAVAFRNPSKDSTPLPLSVCLSLYFCCFPILPLLLTSANAFLFILFPSYTHRHTDCRSFVFFLFVCLFYSYFFLKTCTPSCDSLMSVSISFSFCLLPYYPHILSSMARYIYVYCYNVMALCDVRLNERNQISSSFYDVGEYIYERLHGVYRRHKKCLLRI